MTNVFSHFIQNLPPNERSTIVNTKHRKSPVAANKEASFCVEGKKWIIYLDTNLSIIL
jgi:hypothetical protein